jgi:C4-dicarboxylate-specific signal transduction histidine kinase
VCETVSLLDKEFTAQSISLRLKLDETVPPMLANRVQLQRVLVNILTNAIESVDATERRTRWIEIRSVLLESQDVLIEVTDSGVGIAPEAMEHIFDPFFTTKVTGTGLGLSLSHTIVEEHGGRLWASSGDDYGAVFHLQLPRSRLHATTT